MNTTDSKIVFQKAFNSSLGLFDVNIVLDHDCFSVSKLVPPQLFIQMHSPFVNEVFTGLLLDQLKVFLAHSIHRRGFELLLKCQMVSVVSSQNDVLGYVVQISKVHAAL